ncbi:hypothetical protein O3Z71_000196 [Pseudomonas aeruginosa]|nr:hypothetical protein [Pseudomonas aeruginosa]EKW2845493.1 hypothetical protein [Pseudomonas aeruginosa]
MLSMTKRTVIAKVEVIRPRDCAAAIFGKEEAGIADAIPACHPHSAAMAK